MFDKIRTDFKAVFEMDPAATSKLEVIFTYAGFHAILMHRIAHWLHKMGMPFFARVLSQTARFLTGVEIHPAARIGGSFFIDHGMGVVIGETTDIGEHVVLFQGATLGGTGKERGKRHPTIGNNVVIGAGAKVLGAITVGDHVKVGANSVVLNSVPPHSTVVGVPGRVVRQHGEKIMEAAMLDHAHMPDPLNETLTRMQKQIGRLEQKLDQFPGRKAEPKPEAMSAPGQAAGAPRKGRVRKRAGGPGFGGHPKEGQKADLLPVETVQERQARMARMEKEERMKAIAFKKARDEAAAAEGASEDVSSRRDAPSKKRVRRRRRVRKGGQGAPGGGEAATSPEAAEQSSPEQSNQE